MYILPYLYSTFCCYGNYTCGVVVSGCHVIFNLLVSMASTVTVSGGNGAEIDQNKISNK